MDKKHDTEGADLPPVPGPDSWSSAEASEWDPDEEAQPSGDGDAG
ncbi:hypothetical protein [Cellulomonas xylanilytica]|uniref:Uncharacterized protein n=1 Tax=Cellulomonas xylanilytica TaxID=233583 RepID=A0A510V996_9CELL|nr:hypothetical protein [Cellulomonas xylanilytica]GEK23444.1 hypothetical protein CXY01_39640 [Cellulomonas xylanilytica]